MLAALPSRLVQKKGVQSLFYAVCRNLQDQRVVDRCRRAARLTRSLIPRMEQNATADTLQATAEYFFESHQYELAADRLRSLLASALDPEQRRVITARYVLAASHLSAEESARCAAELPEVPVIQDMDMNELEEMLKLAATSSSAAPPPTPRLVRLLSPRPRRPRRCRQCRRRTRCRTLQRRWRRWRWRRRAGCWRTCGSWWVEAAAVRRRRRRRSGN